MVDVGFPWYEGQMWDPMQIFAACSLDRALLANIGESSWDPLGKKVVASVLEPTRNVAISVWSFKLTAQTVTPEAYLLDEEANKESPTQIVASTPLDAEARMESSGENDHERLPWLRV